MAKVLITGANGHLGRRLIRVMPADVGIEALVRSTRARDVVLKHVGERPGLEVTIGDPNDVDALSALARRCDSAVHLIGTIKSTRDNRYADSHERPARALAAAAAAGKIKHIVYLSILGADANSASACLRARAACENALGGTAIPATVIRIPMVLGERDRASSALARRVRGGRTTVFRADSLEQPIYAGDVITAVLNAIDAEHPANHVYELAGPESLTRRELITRAAAVMGCETRIRSLPLACGMVMAALFEWCLAKPPITRDMLKILDHDDDIDPSAATQALGVHLTPLDEALRRCLHESAGQRTR